MFEHLMFQGSERVPPNEHARMLNRVGGYVSATATEDATFFQNVAPAAYLDFVFQLEADRMRHLVFRPEAIDAVRDLMKEELRQQDASPVTKGLLTLLATSYPKHPYAWTAGGVATDVDAITVAELKAFYDANYQPNNALVVVVGDTTLDAVVAAANKTFGTIAQGPAIARTATADIAAAPTAQRTATAPPGQVGLVLLGFHIPPGAASDVATLQVISALLGGGESARLPRRLQQPSKSDARPLAFQTAAPVLVREHPGLMVVFAAFLDPRNAEAVKHELLEELALLASQDATASELSLAKAQILDAAMSQLEHSSDLAQLIGTSWILSGKPNSFAAQYQQLASITAADLRRTAASFFDKNRATIVTVPPAASKAPPTKAK